jgi:hypothetical protein
MTETSMFFPQCAPPTCQTQENWTVFTGERSTTKKRGAVDKVDMKNSFVECGRKSLNWY